jgi:hypoxanthine-DNA glycosylase
MKKNTTSSPAMPSTDCTGLEPQADKYCTHLVLGSMPGVESLQKQQYYAYPQNRFWPMMAIILTGKEKAPAAYSERLAMMLCHHVALWDAIDTCERKGSLDTAIHNVHGNDFIGFLDRYPKIHTICFNGAKAWQTFKRCNQALLHRDGLHLLALPSTSPANARWKLPQLVAAWSEAFK